MGGAFHHTNDESQGSKKKKNAPHPVSPLRYDSGLYVPVYRGDTTRIIIGKGEGTIISSLLSLEGTPCVPPSRLGEETVSDPPEGEGSGAAVSCVPPSRRLEETASNPPEGEGSVFFIFLLLLLIYVFLFFKYI